MDDQLIERQTAALAEKAEAERAAAAEQPPVDPHEGKIELAGHWVGPMDLIPLASAECEAPPKGCGGTGVVEVARPHVSGKPVLSREICVCAIQAFLDRHEKDLRAIVTAPGIRMPKMRLSKERDKVKARSDQPGAAADQRIARLERARATAEAELGEIEDRVTRAAAPRRRAAERVERVRQRMAQERILAVGDAAAASASAEDIRGRIARLTSDLGYALERQGKAEARAVSLGERCEHALRVAARIAAGADEIRARAGKGAAGLRSDIERYDRKIAIIRGYAGGAPE